MDSMNAARRIVGGLDAARRASSRERPVHEVALIAAGIDDAIDPYRSRISALEAALREIAGADLYERHAADWHDTGKMAAGIRDLAKKALTD